MLIMLSCVTAIHAQNVYTSKDVGKDCVTDNGKMGVVREVKVIETTKKIDSTEGRMSTTTSGGINGGASAKVNGTGLSIEGNVNSSNTGSMSNNQSYERQTTREYTRPECIEDSRNSVQRATPITQSRW